VPTGRDDEALTWGDDDPTLDVGSSAAAADGEDSAAEVAPAASAETVALPDGYTAVGKGSEAIVAAGEAGAEGGPGDRAEATGRDEAEEADVSDGEGRAMGNAELISLGVLGGFSVLYAVGWLIGGLRLQGTAEFLVAALAYQVSLWLAVLAPLAWFATALLLTRGRRLWVRFAWLVGGVVLLVPWPFIMVGAIGR
jgi:hypothetical protein